MIMRNVSLLILKCAQNYSEVTGTEISVTRRTLAVGLESYFTKLTIAAGIHGEISDEVGQDG